MLPAPHALLDMAALAHNLGKLRAFAPQAKIMAVIKANAYGHGATPAAHALASADAFAVARVEEGVALREAGINHRIAILQGFICTEELDLHARYRLEPVVHSAYQVQMLEAHTIGEPVTVWLKLDTGMHRLGLSPEEFEACHRRLSNCPSVRQPTLLMTHLANADMISDPATPSQLDVFGGWVAGLAGERSIANSAWPYSLGRRQDGMGAPWHRPIWRLTISPPDSAGRRVQAGDDLAHPADRHQGPENG